MVDAQLVKEFNFEDFQKIEIFVFIFALEILASYDETYNRNKQQEKGFK